MNKLLSLLLLATIAIAAIPYALGLGAPEVDTGPGSGVPGTTDP